MGILEFIFGSKKNQLEKFISKGAIIVDVRTQREWNNGHIKNSKHIPLDQLMGRLPEIKKLNKPIITVCESGMRSRSATKIINNNGIESINGGSWKRLNEQSSS